MAKRRDLINVPRTIEWNKKPNRKYFLKYLIEKNNFTTMAEIGVRDGRTTFYLLDKISEKGIDSLTPEEKKFLDDQGRD